MFEKAVRMKLRWHLNGAWDVEDLWGMSLQNLDTIYKSLRRQLAQHDEESLLETEDDGETEALNLKADIVKRVVEVKLEERKAREDEATRAEQKQRLLAIYADKQDEALRDKTLDELKDLIEAL